MNPHRNLNPHPPHESLVIRSINPDPPRRRWDNGAVRVARLEHLAAQRPTRQCRSAGVAAFCRRDPAGIHSVATGICATHRAHRTTAGGHTQRSLRQHADPRRCEHQRDHHAQRMAERTKRAQVLETTRGRQRGDGRVLCRAAQSLINQHRRQTEGDRH